MSETHLHVYFLQNLDLSLIPSVCQFLSFSCAVTLDRLKELMEEKHIIGLVCSHQKFISKVVALSDLCFKLSSMNRVVDAWRRKNLEQKDKLEGITAVIQVEHDNLGWELFS